MQRKEVTRNLKALANERRVRIIQELLRMPGLTVGDLGRILKLSYPAISRHIQKLADNDLIRLEQYSLQVLCRVNKHHPAVRALIGLLG
ncbi:MAG: helix-turn-helix domain-containing protein [bacterium]|nr:helix-turn-helix domain-containing protein [bacterium]